ncbi:hypothetical protein NFI96_008357 [Prochilodus magdalenae]|nr:hypothetical protein NFI96_008357 [Prochilodus magdalenae]
MTVWYDTTAVFGDGDVVLRTVVVTVCVHVVLRGAAVCQWCCTNRMEDTTARWMSVMVAVGSVSYASLLKNEPDGTLVTCLMEHPIIPKSILQTRKGQVLTNQTTQGVVNEWWADLVWLEGVVNEWWADLVWLEGVVNEWWADLVWLEGVVNEWWADLVCLEGVVNEWWADLVWLEGVVNEWWADLVCLKDGVVHEWWADLILLEGVVNEWWADLVCLEGVVHECWADLVCLEGVVSEWWADLVCLEGVVHEWWADLVCLEGVVNELWADLVCLEGVVNEWWADLACLEGVVHEWWADLACLEGVVHEWWADLVCLEGVVNEWWADLVCLEGVVHEWWADLVCLESVVNEWCVDHVCLEGVVNEWWADHVCLEGVVNEWWADLVCLEGVVREWWADLVCLEGVVNEWWADLVCLEGVVNEWWADLACLEGVVHEWWADLVCLEGVVHEWWADLACLEGVVHEWWADLVCLEACLTDISSWMTAHHLKLNPSKTELLFIPSTTGPHCDLTISFGNSLITPTEDARSLGVILDGQLSFSAHIANLTRSCRFLLYTIRRIRPFLSQEATQLLVQSLVISRLDYCNSLLAGLPLRAIRPLQLVQNAAARLIFNLPKFTHVTPLLRSLHWLPVVARIRFKTLRPTKPRLDQRLPTLWYQHWPPVRAVSELVLFIPAKFQNNADQKWTKTPTDWTTQAQGLGRALSLYLTDPTATITDLQRAVVSSMSPPVSAAPSADGCTTQDYMHTDRYHDCP